MKKLSLVIFLAVFAFLGCKEKVDAVVVLPPSIATPTPPVGVDAGAAVPAVVPAVVPAPVVTTGTPVVGAETTVVVKP